MPLYSYTAKEFSGQKTNGILESDNLQNFYRMLKERGLFCIEVNEKSQNHPDNPVKQVLQKAETQGSCDLLPSVQRASDGRVNHH
jgi:type II secretory pathway component PulF